MGDVWNMHLPCSSPRQADDDYDDDNREHVSVGVRTKLRHFRVSRCFREKR